MEETRETRIRSALAAAAAAVRETKPFAPSVTNSVTIEFVANTQLACGGSAAMVYLPDEGEAMAEAAGAVYLNVGTLFPFYAETLPRTVRRLASLRRPWVLDPVAAGMGALRTELLLSMKDASPAIVRGNASEILSLASLWGLSRGGKGGGKGVDAADPVEAAEEAAKALARHTGGAVAVSGETDFVTDGALAARSGGGSRWMPEVTGCGCSLGGVMAVYAAVAEPFAAALAATALYNLAGARAERLCRGPGSFKAAFLDELHVATPEDIAGNPLVLEEA